MTSSHPCVAARIVGTGADPQRPQLGFCFRKAILGLKTRILGTEGTNTESFIWIHRHQGSSLVIIKASWDPRVCWGPALALSCDLQFCSFRPSNAQYIVSGSDDGSFFIWEKETTNLVRVLQGDESIVNCLQPHPSYCFLATSGIDPVVRLWNPRPEVRAAGKDSRGDVRGNADPIFPAGICWWLQQLQQPLFGPIPALLSSLPSCLAERNP